MKEKNEIVLSRETLFLAPAGTVEDFLKAYQLKKEIIQSILREGVDFGIVPGSEKPALLKAGAEKMSNFYALSPDFVDIKTVEDWTGQDHNGEPFFYYRQKCNLYKNQSDGTRIFIASADGSCSSWEKKYRYRQAERVCPNCGKPAIIKGKQEYGGGWLCFIRKGGCNAKFLDDAPEIVNQDVGQVKNPDVAEQVNTMLKMAQKRALVAATLIATNTSDYFTQDIEDMSSFVGEMVTVKAEDVPGEEQESKVESPVEMIDPMKDWAVGFAANEWNIEKSEAAQQIAKMGLPKNVAKDNFILAVKSKSS
jgi:hypothetical protein